MFEPKIKCPNCKYEGRARAGRSGVLEIIFFILGFFTWGTFWLVWIFYRVFTAGLVCPQCGFKNVFRQ